MAVEDDIISSDNSNPKTFVGSSSDLNLSFGNPLYLHPNDTSDSSNPDLANQWDMCNFVVVTWILNSLSPELFVGVIYAKTASEIWNDLKETYDKVDGFTVFNLDKNINSLNQNGSPLANYYNKLNSLWKQFDAMVSLPACTCAAAKHFDQHNQLIKLMQFLMGLDESYLSIRSNLLTREPLPSVKNAFSIISGEEAHRNVTPVGTTKPATTALATKTFDNKKKPETSNNASADVHSNGASNNNDTTGNSIVSLSSEQLARLMNLLNKNGVSSANANMAGLIVGHPNGTQALITKIRDLNINIEVTLYDVLVVPTLSVFYLFISFQETGNDDSGATFMDKTNNTHPKDTISDETDFLNDFYVNSKFNYKTEDLLVHTLRRSSRQTKLPSNLNDFIVEGKVKYDVERVVNYVNLNHDNYFFSYALNKRVEPTCYEEAILDNNWIGAMNAEIEVLNENHTWKITNLPPNRKAIGNKWIYKIKYKSSGDIDRYMARLVVKGFNKKEGIDFDETFSPVVKMSTVKCVIALSVTNNWHLFQLDVNNAFLYGDLDEDIYTTIPKGFASKDNKNKVCKLVKSLYGLNQDPRKYNEKLVSVLKENGFVQSNNDHTLFTKSNSNKFIAFLVYLDDIVITGNCVDEIDKFKCFLKFKFKIKDLGHLKYFLGIKVIKTSKDLCLSQRKYCLELLKDYGLLGCKLVSTRMEPNSVLPYVPTKDDPLLDNITGYQKLLGKLIYLTHTRPDIAYSVHCLAQYMHSLLKSHLNSALNVLRYLKGAPSKGIRYTYSEYKNNLSGYSDAD
nr:ribonuclease H-like domain-containing protein [Tanacetum cinerariifolium]